MPSVVDIQDVVKPDLVAIQVASLYNGWKVNRDKKEKAWNEIRNYVFATDTTTTSNAKLPWRNSTTRPKLCQIRDNLHANYMAALFPTENWFRWIAGDRDSATATKASAIEGYMNTKLNEMKFREFVSRALYDYIDYGNCFADVEHVRETHSINTGEIVTTYVGPRPVRISPLDIVFDITAASFEQSPKVVRRLYALGYIAKMIQTMPLDRAGVWQKILDKAVANRINSLQWDKAELQKSEGFVADGFSNLYQYYSSNMVEVLTYEGDFYDPNSGKLYPAHRIVVVDRAYVAELDTINNWYGRSAIVHAGWRLRPDNLMAMGPLDNLVGMQYRIDHLENLRADIFDMIAFPIVKHRGYVEDWVWGPGEKIFMDENAEVDMLHPDGTALAADQQIADLEYKMEEMAGAPKEAMGIRSPGEKTAFEVQQLSTSASRMFENKVSYFEEMFVEPILNNLLEQARRNMDTADVIRKIDNTLGIVQFETITKDDLTAKGKLQPMGARHFASQNKLVQNLTSLTQTGAYQDPGVQVHFSGWEMAKLLSDALGLNNYKIVQKNIRVTETAETQALQSTAQEAVLSHSITPSEDPEAGDLINEIPSEPATPTTGR